MRALAVGRLCVSQVLAPSMGVPARHEATIPPSIKLDQAKGFALHAMRTLLSGRGDGLLGLTRAELRQVF